MIKRKNGFTLAEMLITLSVIGIVAALTIPGLVKNHNEKAWATAQDVFTKKLEIAMKAMNTDGTLTGYQTTASFVNALKKNIKITKVCTDDVTKCFSKEVIWNEGEDPIEITNNIVQYDDSQGQDWAETVGVQFNNGVTALIAYNKNCQSDPFNNQYAASAACIGIVYDVQGHKKPNTNGKDLASNANVASLGSTSACLFEFSNGQCITKILGPQNGGYSVLNTSGTNCVTAKAQYGLTYCNGSQDYYAGAAAACGHKSNLPTLTQLGELATYVYNYGSTIGAQQNISSDLTLDKDKAANFLANSPYGNDASNPRFYVWSSEALSSGTVYSRDFSSTLTYYHYDYSPASSCMLAVCLGE